MILFLDTSDLETVQLALVADQTVWHKFASRNLSEELLPQVKKFLQKEKIKLSDLKKVAVVVGPGGFSRIRTAVSTANALALGLNAPVIGINKAAVPKNLIELDKLKSQQMVEPVYDKNPNITLPKK